MSPTRRAFLGSLGGLAAGYALAPALRAAESNGKPLGLALCGLGNYSNGELSPALLETKNVKLVAAITGTREKGVKLAKLHGFDEANIYSYDQWDKVAANKAIDIVYVVTPPGIHAQNVIAAFGAGKHVICEKPMAVSAAECDTMIAAGKKAGKRLAIGYRLHFDPYHQELVRLAKSQEFGPFMKIKTANGFTLRRKAWRIDKKLAGGGYFKIVNQSVPRALRTLGYDDDAVNAIVRYAVGTCTLEGAPHINRETLKAKGFLPEEIDGVTAEQLDKCKVAMMKTFQDEDVKAARAKQGELFKEAQYASDDEKKGMVKQLRKSSSRFVRPPGPR